MPAHLQDRGRRHYDFRIFTCSLSRKPSETLINIERISDTHVFAASVERVTTPTKENATILAPARKLMISRNAGCIT
jgi:hypothetical protein